MAWNMKDTVEILLQSAIGLAGVNVLHTTLSGLSYVIPLLKVSLGDTIALTAGLAVAKLITNAVPYFKGNRY